MTRTLTPEQHGTRAETILAESETYGVANPYRADMIARATVHALLALQPSDAGAELAETTTTPAPRKRTAKKTTTPKETTA